MIPQTVRDLIYGAQYCHADIASVARSLPVADAELDEWLATAIDEGDPLLLNYLATAAASEHRPLAPHHLVKGIPLLANDQFVAWMVWNTPGPVASVVVQAIEGAVIPQLNQATALFAAVARSLERDDDPLPPNLMPIVRRLARNKKIDSNARVCVVAIANMTKDEALASMLGPDFLERTLEPTQRWVDAQINVCRGSVLALIPKDPSRTLARGTTMRRSVARLGRNEPCPCGSGKKYKRCCYETDQERLHHSSSVAGKTHAELLQEPGTDLTRKRLDAMHAHQLRRLDPASVPSILRVPYFMRLGTFSLFDRMLEAMEKFPWDGKAEEQKHAWRAVLFFAVKSWRPDVAKRLLAFDPDGSRLAEHPGGELLLHSPDAPAFLAALERLAGKVVASTDDAYRQNFALGLLWSPLRSAGILVARSMLSIVPQREAALLFNEILAARDKLNLSPDDPFSDIIDERFTEEASHHEGQEADQVRHAQRKLAEKAREVRRLKETLERTRREIARHETPPATASPAASPAPDPQVLSDLRDKVRQLKSTLTERHEERATLRRELQTAQTDLAALQQAAPAASPSDRENPAADPEEDLFLPGEVDGNQPVRLIEFPKKFRQTLARYPRPTARAAVSMIGRLAAGEPGAYAGVVRLRACHEILRQRIGSDYRLLFQLDSDNLRVIDLINRKDLATTIKHLRLTPPPAA
jgi:mRNA-degrading endonuclease RelE of RelBE toxin-antitoxin system